MKRRRWSREVALALLLICASVALLAAANLFARQSEIRAGDLDRRFGSDGRVVTKLEGFLRLVGLTQASDGRLFALVRGIDGVDEQDSALLAYHRDGRLDRSFGRRGKVLLRGLLANDLVVQPDGRPVVLVEGRLVRYSTEGVRDPAFAQGSSAAVSFNTEDLIRLPDGRFVVAGYRPTGPPQPPFGPGGDATSELGVARYLTNGSVDESFGGADGVTTSIGSGETYPGGLVVQRDGKVVVSATFEPGSGRATAVLRYRPDGSLDPAFGKQGRATLGASAPGPLAVQPDGRLVLAGYNEEGDENSPSFVARFRSNGALDRSFGRRGKTLLKRPSQTKDFLSPRALVVAPPGRIVVGGVMGSLSPRFAVARLTPRGSLDRSFGRRGTVVTVFRRSSQDESLRELVLGPSGQLTAGGEIAGGVGLARYHMRSASSVRTTHPQR